MQPQILNEIQQEVETMPWTLNTLAAVSAGLRCSALDGDFVPFEWNAGIQHTKDGGYRIYGCGWGQVAWLVAVFQGGADYARRMLPVGAGHNQVVKILKASGLTWAEIEQMDPQSVWTRFDFELEDAYNGRKENPEHFVAMSHWLAEFFIEVLEDVPVVPEDTVQSVEVEIDGRTSGLTRLFSGFFGKKEVLEAV